MHPGRVDTPQEPRRSRQRTLIYMGSFMDYKNVEDLIRGMSALPEYTPAPALPDHSRREGRARDLAGAAGVREAALVFHRGVTDEAYMDLLSQATALVTLSQSGYGLPVAEASSRAPRGALRPGIFREIGGPMEKAARFVALDERAAVVWPERVGSSGGSRRV